jgi:hypothetical protein
MNTAKELTWPGLKQFVSLGYLGFDGRRLPAVRIPPAITSTGRSAT